MDLLMDLLVVVGTGLVLIALGMLGWALLSKRDRDWASAAILTGAYLVVAAPVVSVAALFA